MPDVLFTCYFPVSRHISKKNSRPIFRRGSKSFIGKSTKLHHAEAELEQRLRIEKIKQRLDDVITCDVNAEFIFYFPKSVYFVKKGTRSQKIPDLSNLYEIVQDSLQKVGIISNDTIICGHDHSRRQAVDDSRYWLRIVLTRLEPRSE